MFRSIPRLASLTSRLVSEGGKATQVPFTAKTNPYKAKRLWPPDFSKLDHRHQFRLERRYRRRAKLAWARPGWTKAVTLVQWGSIIFVVVYMTLFMDWEKKDDKDIPVEGVRRWYKDLADSFWTNSHSGKARASAEEIVRSQRQNQDRP